MDNRQEPGNWVDHLKVTYVRIMKALAALVIPIELRRLQDNVYSEKMRDDLIRALRIAADLPITAEELRQVENLIIDWLTAADHLFAHEESGEDWRIIAFALQIRRIYGELLLLDQLRSQE